VRELAGAIHPSVLVDRGIVNAIETRASRLPIGVTIEADGALRYARFEPMIEGAIYFAVSDGAGQTPSSIRGRSASPFGFPNAARCSRLKSLTTARRMSDAPLKVVIAEDHDLVREGTRRLLEESGEVETLAAVGNAAQLLVAVDRLHPALSACEPREGQPGRGS
jgi:hypothetical protein